MAVLRYFFISFLIIAAAFTMNSESVLPYVLAQHPEHSVFHGSRTVAGLHLELAVEPVPIEPGALTKFGTIFTDAATGEPMLEVPHTFVLVKDDQVIFRESIKSASYIHEFSFAEEHQGQLTILIENVNNSGESIEFSLMIIPEFPLSSMFAMTAMLAIVFTILRFKGVWKPRT